VLRTRECALTPSLSVVFTFGLAVESIKELGGASVVFLGIPYIMKQEAINPLPSQIIFLKP
jgi:hypothetical protein